MYTFLHTHTHTRTQNLLNPFSVANMYVFRADHLGLKKPIRGLILPHLVAISCP